MVADLWAGMELLMKCNIGACTGGKKWFRPLSRRVRIKALVCNGKVALTFLSRWSFKMFSSKPPSGKFHWAWSHFRFGALEVGGPRLWRMDAPNYQCLPPRGAVSPQNEIFRTLLWMVINWCLDYFTVDVRLKRFFHCPPFLQQTKSSFIQTGWKCFLVLWHFSWSFSGKFNFITTEMVQTLSCLVPPQTLSAHFWCVKVKTTQRNPFGTYLEMGCFYFISLESCWKICSKLNLSKISSF